MLARCCGTAPLNVDDNDDPEPVSDGLGRTKARANGIAVASQKSKNDSICLAGRAENGCNRW